MAYDDAENDIGIVVESNNLGEPEDEMNQRKSEEKVIPPDRLDSAAPNARL